VRALASNYDAEGLRLLAGVRAGRHQACRRGIGQREDNRTETCC
jgi:hypothetical protein